MAINKKIKNYIFGILFGIGSFLVGFGVTGIITSWKIEKPELKDLRTLPKAFIVQSGSMEPVLKTGSIVFTLPAEFYKQGDIVTFKKGGKSLVTHRIALKEYPEGLAKGPEFSTKGDANDSPDSEHIKEENIVGKVFFSIPYLGYAANYAKKPHGFILLVIIPGTIIIYEELKSLLRELSKLLKKTRTYLSAKVFKKNRKKNEELSVDEKIQIPLSQSEVASKHNYLANILAIVPVLGAFLVFVALSSALFNDKEQSSSNVFSASAFFNSPTPVVSPSITPGVSPTPGVANYLVINEVLPDSSCKVGNSSAQWLEIYNGYPTTVNLKNFKISDGSNVIELVNSNTDIVSGGLALLAHDAAVWTQCFNDNNVTKANLGGTLNIDTGHLQLLDSSDIVIDDVVWGGATGLTPVQDQSIEREPDGKDTGTVADFLVRPTPQPGL